MANYNINAVTRRVVYTGSAGLGPYAFSFEILTQTDVDVYFNDTLLTITTDYTVTINANGTGSITIVTGTNVPTTPDADDQITIVGARDIERVTDFVTAGDFRASAINEQLDALTIFDQQLAESDDRTVKAPVTDPTSIDMTLPKKADRASKFLLFSATGDVGVASTDTLTVSTLQAFTDYQVDTFTGDNTTVVFTLSAEPGQKGNTQVYFDGVYQAKVNYSLVGTALTFSTAPATSVKVEVVHGQAAATYTPDNGSITFAKLATAAVDTDLTSVSASHDTLPTALATKTYVDAQVGANNELSEVLANGNTSGGTNIVVSAGDSITTDTIAETTAAAGVTIDGVLVKDGEVDGRDVSVDGTKLDTVETNADVTDTTNVTAAGALMDSELTNITAVKALDQGVATTDTPTFAGVITAGNVDGRDVSVDGAKLDGIEAGADVTDTANVTAAGALMDSELTNITAVKALNQGVATTDSPSFAGLTATTADINGGTIDGAVIGGASAAAGTFTTLRANTSLGVNGAGVSNVAAAISGADRPLASDDTANLVVYSTTTPATDVGGSIGFGHSSHGGALLGVIKGMKASSGTNIGEMAFALRSDAAFSTEVARLTSAQFGMSNAAGPSLLNETASSTNPTLVPNKADPDTGLGWVSANVGALIAGGTKNISWDNTHVGLNGMTPNAPAQGNFSVTMGGIGSTGSGLLQIVGNAAGAYRNAGVHFVGYDGGSYSENAVIEQHYTTGTASGSLVFKTKAQAGSLTTALTLGDDQNATFTGNVSLSNATGPALMNEAASATNPTIIPNRVATTSGFGANGAGNTIYGIGSGAEHFRFGNSAMHISVGLTVAAQLSMDNAAGPTLLNEAATSTNPTLVPNRADTDTGVGWNSTNIGSLIAGGTEVASFAAAAFNITGAANVKQANNGVSGGLVLTRSDSAVYSSVYTGGDDKTYLQNNNGRYIAITSTTGDTGGASSAGSGNQYVELLINGSRYKLLHDGTI
jgi:hypothetical protein